MEGAASLTCLYRHFDADGSLLYVGISLSWPERTKAHAQKSRWFSHVAEVKIERFPTRQEALDAEREAIRREHPKFNIVHNRRPVVRRNPHASKWVVAESREELQRRLAPQKRRLEKNLAFKEKMDALAKERGWQGPLKHWIDSPILDVGDHADGSVLVLLHCATHSENEWHWIGQHEFETISAGEYEPGWVYSRR